ncbi:MAG TPA: hypothetical protein PK413_03645 [Thermoanaerobaculia bacterium]|nr:hypothetical protein [Thermoanaerobaculia bacterium]
MTTNRNALRAATFTALLLVGLSVLTSASAAPAFERPSAARGEGLAGQVLSAVQAWIDWFGGQISQLSPWQASTTTTDTPPSSPDPTGTLSDAGHQFDPDGR